VYAPPLAFAWWLSRYVPPDRLDDTSPDGLVVSEVYLAQIHQSVSLLYLCAVLLYTMPEPELYGRALHRLQEGLQLGWKAGNLLAQRWELGWERPLAEWRRELVIEPVRA